MAGKFTQIETIRKEEKKKRKKKERGKERRKDVTLSEPGFFMQVS